MRKLTTFPPKKIHFRLVFAGVFLFLATLSFLSEGTHGGADDFVHYRIARYAFQYPHLFLDHWGKPLFTALCAPFAQLGYWGARIFNVLAATGTLFYAFRLAYLLKFRTPYLIIPFILFAPIYLIISLTVMTEILFGFVLILGIYLFFREKYLFSALVISFLPFARSEGIFILPLFFLAFILNKRFKEVPFLLFGIAFYSLIGGIFSGDFLWLLHQNPYTGAVDIYGTGSLWHFVAASKWTLGIPLTIMYLIGLLIVTIKIIRSKFQKKTNLNFLLLVVLPYLTYLAAHSLMWYLGVGSSLGLLRVLAAVVPLAAFVCLQAWEFIEQKLPQKYLQKGLLILFLLFLVYTPFREYQLPVRLSPPQILVQQTADWLKKSPYFQGKIYYYDPFFSHTLGLNPFETNRIAERVPNSTKPANGIPEKSIVIWDAHFSPNEGRLPLQNLMQSPDFQLIKTIKPKENFTVLGGYNYEIYIFFKQTK